MKIVQINAVYAYSSTGRTTEELHKELRKQGHCSYVFCTNFESDNENIYRIGNKLDQKVHGFLSRLSGEQAHYSRIATFKMLRKINEIHPDVIHLRNLHGNYIDFPMLMNYLNRKQIPIVITLHDCWFFTGKCCYYTDDHCDRWMYECGNCPALRKWNKSWFFDKSTKLLKEKEKLFSKASRVAVVGVSQWIADEAKKSILKHAWKIDKIYNWINLDVFYPRTNVPEELANRMISDYTVLGVSQSWSREKGINIFIDLANRFPDIQFVLVGNMPERVILPSNILSVRTVSNPEKLADYYSFADVFVNPSIQETFGKTTAEAIACGTPVIGFNVTATPELIGNECGLVVDVADGMDGIATAIEHLRKKGKKFYSSSCRTFAETNFNKQKLINKYIQLYKEIVV